jgi:hypothetical protein
MPMPVLDLASSKILKHRQLRQHPEYKDVWDTSYTNELGRLCQGVGVHPQDPTRKRVDGTNTLKPMQYANIPIDRQSDIAHTRVVYEERPTKAEIERICITVGGNTIDYPGDCGTKTGSLELVKLILNSVCLCPNARFLAANLGNFYLGTPLDCKEYIRIKLSVIPQEFIDEYGLLQFSHNGWIYFEVSKGIYGLKQAGKLAIDLLAKRLHVHGYYQCATTPGLWRHKWQQIMFFLVVDNFGIEYFRKIDADHLLNALQQSYTVATDWMGTKFAGIDIKWDYNKRTVQTTMDGCITNIQACFGHPDPAQLEHSPHKHRAITYRAKAQYLENDGIKRVQGIIGSLLYYARAVDPKLLLTLNAVGIQQAAETKNTLAEVVKLLNYTATYQNDGTTHHDSNMVLAAHSDASYLSKSKSRSRVGAHIFFSENNAIPQPNGPILCITKVIKTVMASAAEDELSVLFTTAQEMIPLQNTLEEMGWPQPKSPIQVENSTATGLRQQHNCPTSTQVNRIATQLAQMMRSTRPIPNILG